MIYKRFVTELDDALVTGNDVSGSRSRIFETGFISNLQKVLDELISDPRNIEAHIHPLGFLVITLLKSDEVFLRLHVWNHPDLASYEVSDGLAIHDHRIHFESFVVCGALRHKIFEVVKDDGGGQQIMVMRRTVDGEMAFLPGDTVRVSFDENEVFDAGTVYRMEPGVFHEAGAAGDDLTVTLCRMTDFDPKRLVRAISNVGNVAIVEPESCACEIGGEFDVVRIIGDLKNAITD